MYFLYHMLCTCMCWCWALAPIGYYLSPGAPHNLGLILATALVGLSHKHKKTIYHIISYHM